MVRAMSDPVEENYDWYPEIEEEFQTLLDESLHPRGPEMLFDLVGAFGLPSGAVAVDVGCGEGRHAIELADRFGFAVTGIDPSRRSVQIARAAAASSSSESARFEVAGAEVIPLEDGSVDLVWCRDSLVHVADLNLAYSEFRRVLRAGGRGLVYQSCFATDRLEPKERQQVFEGLEILASSTHATSHEVAIARAGLVVDEMVEVGLEWGERSQEKDGSAGRRLIHVARLLRDPGLYIERFGQRAYDLMLADCHWHVYRLLGKLDARVYVLSRPGP
jgi:ubiquinone/menaquinone biosynthesis C-methylase UbiE